MTLSAGFTNTVFWISVVLCAVAQAGILRSTWRGMSTRSPSPANTSYGPDRREDRTPHIRRAPEFIWAVLPPIALAFVFLATWKAMHRVADAGDQAVPRPPIAEQAETRLAQDNVIDGVKRPDVRNEARRITRIEAAFAEFLGEEEDE